jgi:hypothetical protein
LRSLHGPMKFPVLCLPRDTGVYLAKTTAHLSATRVSAEWTNRIFSGMKIVDASGSCFVVRSYAVKTPRTPFFRKVAEFLELKRELELQVEPIAQVDISELRASVLRNIQEDAEGLEELSGRSTSWWHAQLNEATTCQAVVAALSRA